MSFSRHDLGAHAAARCLDGSPGAFYLRRGNPRKWLIYLEGGGWCYDEDDCFERSSTKLGSSKDWQPVAGCGCMNTVGDGIDMSVCKQFLQAASDAGNQSMLVKASNEKEIAAAFENVAAAMSAGVSEAL